MEQWDSAAVVPLHQERAKEPAHKKLASFEVANDYSGSVRLYGDAPGDTPTLRLCNTLEAFLDTVLESYAGYTLCCHAGECDSLNALLDVLRALLGTDQGYSLTTLHQGEKVIGYTIAQDTEHTLTRGKRAGTVQPVHRVWTLLDVFPLFNTSVQEMATAFCAGITGSCEVIYHAYRALETLLFAAFSARPGRTAGGTALKAFKASIPDGHVYYRSHADVEQFVRRAYRGGLVLPGTTTKPQADVALVDMSGAYGYQMLAHRFPVGAPCHTYSYQPHAVGVYQCYVNAPPDLRFGIIAAEHEAGYPLGSFYTVCTSVEMDYARTLGYTFEVVEGYYWTREEPVFQPFMERCQELERSPHKKSLAKLLRNTLYGKFCTRTDAEHFCVLPLDASPPVGAMVILDSKTGDEVPGLYSVATVIDEPYLMPIWGVLITAYQRVYVAERAMALYAAGAPSVYVDTDSLAAPRRAVEAVRRTGWLDRPELGVYGRWKLEALADTFIVGAPKVYVLLDNAGHILRSRAKGLPLKQLESLVSRETFEQANQQSYTYVASNSIPERLKRPDLPIKITRARKMSLMQRSPGWSYDAATGIIKPLVVYQEKKQWDARSYSTSFVKPVAPQWATTAQALTS